MSLAVYILIAGTTTVSLAAKNIFICQSTSKDWLNLRGAHESFAQMWSKYWVCPPGSTSRKVRRSGQLYRGLKYKRVQLKVDHRWAVRCRHRICSLSHACGFLSLQSKHAQAAKLLGGTLRSAFRLSSLVLLQLLLESSNLPFLCMWGDDSRLAWVSWFFLCWKRSPQKLLQL